MISWAKGALNRDCEVVRIDGLGIPAGMLQRIAHAVPSGKGVRLLFEELLVEGSRLFELSCSLITKRQFVDGCFIQRVFLQSVV